MVTLLDSEHDETSGKWDVLRERGGMAGGRGWEREVCEGRFHRPLELALATNEVEKPLERISGER